VKKQALPPEKKTVSPPKAKPSSVDYDAAISHFNKGNFGEAELILSRICNSQDTITREALRYLIRTLANQGKLDAAIDLCNQALDSHKLDGDIYFLLANIQQEMGNSDEAVLNLKKVIFLHPGHALAHFSLGNQFLKKSNKTEANRHFRNTIKILSKLDPATLLPDSGGITAKELLEVTKLKQSMIEMN
jgi:tetratricopeptide (TPR) repeat protein